MNWLSGLTENMRGEDQGADKFIIFAKTKIKTFTNSKLKLK